MGWIFAGVAHIIASQLQDVQKMIEKESNRKEQFIKTITREKMGSAFGYSKPIISKTVGPYFPEAFDDYALSVKSVELAYYNYLGNIELFNLELQFENSGRPKVNPLSDMSFWKQLIFENANDLNAKEPIWIEGGFGHPHYEANVEYWSKMPTFKFDELLLLSVGVDPLKAKVIDIYNLGSACSKRGFGVIEFLTTRSNLLRRKFNTDGYDDAVIKPIRFIEFVDFSSLQVEPNFLEALRKIHQPRKQKEEIDPREKTSLLTLIAVMAKDGYGYDPSKRSPVIAEIYDVAKLNGIEISKETIRNHLKTSMKSLTSEWKTK